MNDDLMAELQQEIASLRRDLQAVHSAYQVATIQLSVVEQVVAELSKPILQLAKTPALSIVPVAPAVTVVPEPPKSHFEQLTKSANDIRDKIRANGDKPVEPDGGKAWIAAKPTKPKKVEVVPVREDLVINDEWRRVIDLLNNGSEHLFITGGAGTGKSTLLEHFIGQTRKSTAVVAPTGVAALRVRGETIHHFFNFAARPYEKGDTVRVSDDTRRKKFEKLEVLIIDEISMVRADIMDAIEEHLRKNGPQVGRPFGGVRIIMFGDPFQLPPVSKDKSERKFLEYRYGTPDPFFFHAECFRDNTIRTCELTTIFRQKDPTFTDALNAIRRGVLMPEHMTLLNSRVNPKFVPAGDEMWLTLTTTNAAAELANTRMLSTLSGTAGYFNAIIDGDFDPKDYPTHERLELKPGAAVMFIRNVPGKWVNGTMGKVVKVKPLTVDIQGIEQDVEPEIWEKYAYEFDEDTQKLTRKKMGEFIQIPIKVAAAITIHKSQGLSLDRAIIDLSHGAFSAGQGYVAFSRLRSLEGMVLRQPLRDRDVIVSNEVLRFMQGQPIARPKTGANGQLTLAV